MANSPHIVLPLPVGAPTNTSSSVLYSALNTEEEKEEEEEEEEEEEKSYNDCTCGIQS